MSKQNLSARQRTRSPLHSTASQSLLWPVVCAALALPQPAALALGSGETATPTDAASLSLKQIMAHPDWLGSFPEAPRWAADGSAIYFERKQAGNNLRDLYRIDLANLAAGAQPVAEDQQANVAGVEGDWTRDGKRRVFVRNGDVFLHDLETGRLAQLTRSNEPERSPRFQADPRYIAYRRGSDADATWIVRDTVTGTETLPVELRLIPDPDASDPTKPDPAEPFVGRQEERLFAVLAEREARARATRAGERAQQAADPSRPPLPWYLGKPVVGKAKPTELEVLEHQLSPSGLASLVVFAPKERDEGREDLMPIWVNQEGYVRTKEVRPKVGSGKASTPTITVLDLAQHQRHDLDLGLLPGIHETPLAGLATDPNVGAAAKPAASFGPSPARQADGDKTVKRSRDKAAKSQGTGSANEPAAPPATRAVAVEAVAWSRDGRHLLLDLRAADNKDRWLATVDTTATTPALVPRVRLSDPAWINYAFSEIGWLADGSGFWYLSEQAGYAHLWVATLDGRAPRALTAGNFEVDAPEWSRDGRVVYLRANREHPGIWELYRLELTEANEPSPLVRVTHLGGVNEAVLSPDERQLLVTHSSALEPNELWLLDIAVGIATPSPASSQLSPTPDAADRTIIPAQGSDVAPATPPPGATRLTNSRSTDFAAISWTPPRWVAVPSQHGAGQPIWSRLYLPEDATPSPGGDVGEGRPAVLFVHGAGYLQNAHHGWSGYFREFMFHTRLTRLGYVVLDMDYRASSGYGRDWRTAIYRQMGTPEVQDLADGVAWLTANAGVDPTRVGVYGGSYGGFLTFMAMFKEPTLFAAGAALRPVTDWAHYNQGYTSNILNTPETDPEAYRRSSPIEHAAGLAKPVLICHGMVDDNVLFLDTVRLVQRLIELEKTALFETAIYPVEPHGFLEPSSWLDEYARILALFERTIGSGPSQAGEATK